MALVVQRKRKISDADDNSVDSAIISDDMSSTSFDSEISDLSNINLDDLKRMKFDEEPVDFEGAREFLKVVDRLYEFMRPTETLEEACDRARKLVMFEKCCKVLMSTKPKKVLELIKEELVVDV